MLLEWLKVAPRSRGPRRSSHRVSMAWIATPLAGSGIPFAIPAAPKVAAPVESIFKDLAVKSAYGPKNSPTFSIVNTRTHERFPLSMEKPKDGFEVKSFKLGESRKDITVEVQKGSETATLTYAADYVSPAAGGAAPQQGINGRPPIPGGVIPRPGMTTGMTTTATMPRGMVTPATQNQATMNNTNRAMPNSPVVVGGGGAGIGSVAGNATAAATDTTPRRRTLIPSNATVAAGGNPTIQLGTGAGTTPGTSAPSGTPGAPNVSPPIVRPPPSIYLDGNSQGQVTQ
ncbi:MAG: hypothetical protein IPK32_05650 [Verrucomicrobiaceae bacterium]|nr:hypothetical protein [Verrucomicrobiaceae bacterium]